VPQARVEALSRLLGGELLGSADLLVERIDPLERAGPDSISFLSNPRYAQQLNSTRAGCVIAAPAHREALARLPSAIVCADPYLAFARLTQWWAAQAARPAAPGVHPSAVVHAQARVDPSATVGALAVIGAGAVVGAGAVIGSHAVLEDDAHVGARSRICAGVFIGARCTLGERCIVHPGVVIGADGFGFAPHQGRWEKIEQLGAVRIGDDVEIGANTCIDRGALDDTVIGDGVKLDNLIQIGHNVRVGRHTAMAACVGVAGSATIGAHCTIGGAAVVLGHLELADRVNISAASVVTRSILRAGHYSGLFPIDDNSRWEKNAAALKRLHDLRTRVQALEKRTNRSNTP
jgi:UDP-3-O-[3-hydroxymyristoyl] glucosamine N-acyltransferase